MVRDGTAEGKDNMPEQSEKLGEPTNEAGRPYQNINPHTMTPTPLGTGTYVDQGPIAVSVTITH